MTRLTRSRVARRKRLGDLTDNDDLKREGKVDRATSSVKEKVEETVDKVRDKVKDTLDRS